MFNNGNKDNPFEGFAEKVEVSQREYKDSMKQFNEEMEEVIREFNAKERQSKKDAKEAELTT